MLLVNYIIQKERFRIWRANDSSTLDLTLITTTVQHKTLVFFENYTLPIVVVYSPLASTRVLQLARGFRKRKMYI